MAAPSSSDQWISTFLEAQAAELGSATNTLLAYGRDLKDYCGWLDRSKGHIDTAGRDDIEAYLIDCDAQGLSLLSLYQSKALQINKDTFCIVYRLS